MPPAMSASSAGPELMACAFTLDSRDGRLGAGERSMASGKTDITGWAVSLLGAAPPPRPAPAAAQPVRVDIPDEVAREIGQQAESANLGILAALGLEGAATVEEEVPVPMRDGVRLSATIVHPLEGPSPDVKSSVILVKTPYSPVGELTYGFRKDMF